MTMLASVGVIGGADGPTAVFVAASPGPGWMWIVRAVVLAAVITAIVLVCRARRKKK